MSKVLGVLGGMGPAATLDFLGAPQGLLHGRR
jgi:aspartate/glutamate racemase